jgi:hypothetical protein
MSALGLVMYPLVVATELISGENEAHDTPAENVWRRDNRRFDDVRPAAKVDPDLGPVAHQERDVIEQFNLVLLGPLRNDNFTACSHDGSFGQFL